MFPMKGVLPYAGAAAALCWLFTPSSRADEMAPAVRISYKADAGCPDKVAFFAKLRARAPQIELVEDETRESEFSVALRSEPSGFTGSLVRQGPDGTKTVRQVQGDSCEALAAALALATVLAVDADPAAATATSAANDTMAASTSPPLPAPAPEAEQPAVVSLAPSTSPGVRRWRWAVGGNAGILNVLPGFNFEGTLFGDVTRWGPGVPLSLRLSVAYAFPHTQAYSPSERTVTETVRTVTETVTGGAQACILRWPAPSNTLGLRPCLGIDLGSLATTGEVTEQGGASTSNSERHFWADATVAARAEWPLTAMVEVELQTRAIFPLTRYRYVILSPSTPVDEVDKVPAVAAGASLGALVRFP
jgi:hypothetical protein